MTEEEKFWGEVDIGSDDECWEWKRGISWDGYGQFYWKEHDGPRRSNRVAWELMYGAIPDGMLVCHSCDNPRCCNPAHLFLGTDKDNAQDARRKGRLVRSEESRKRCSVAKIGNHYTLGFHHTEASKLNMRKARVGMILSDEARRKMSEAHKGKPKSEEARRKMREAWKRRKDKQKEQSVE